MSGGGDTRAIIQVPNDAIILDPPDPVNNNSESQDPAASQHQKPKVVIGEPKEGFNINQMMIISHNYFEKVEIPSDDGGPGEVRAMSDVWGKRKGHSFEDQRWKFARSRGSYTGFTQESF